MKTLDRIYRVQRATLGVWAAVAGGLSLAGIFLPNAMAHQVLARSLGATALVLAQRADGARLGLAVVALAAAFLPRPPRALVWALFVALAASAVGPVYARLVAYIPPPELAPFHKLLFIDGAAALILLVTQEWRAYLVRKQARGG